MKALGIDVGSLTTKAVLLQDGQVLSSSVVLSSDTADLSARSAAEQALHRVGLGLDDEVYVTTTGAGGRSVSFRHQQKAITTCLARGICHLFPSARMAIDMGAESMTIIKVNDRGRLCDWANQDKCAAGTGVFLQQMAKLLQVPLEEMAALSLQARARADISATCAVFAESEVISHVHRVPPTPKEEIAAGIFLSVAHRVMALCKRIGIEKEVAVTGGVALNSGLVSILQEEMGFDLLVPEAPQGVAALGAAIVARESIEGGTG
ncbi:MAG: 2-hydroxyglutaryl-CoA dehydratase [Chloroflexi bacterium]|nr:MAG: 2-hydroxyglutaryl-CoA dehydratase [Chloroflexota bacterium]